jgi:PAS domain S-box-containing protein
MCKINERKLNFVSFNNYKVLKFKFYHSTFLFCILWMCRLHSVAQVYEFQNFNQDNGIPSSSILCLFQDSRNLIWIGTDGGGLIKHDGNSFTVYDDSEGLKGTFVMDVLEDVNSNIIIASRYSGIFVFDGKHFFKQFLNTNSQTKSNVFYKLIVGSKGIYAIGEQDIVLIKKDYSLEVIATHNRIFGTVNSLQFDNQSNLWIGTEDGLFILENKTLRKIEPELFSGHVSLAKNNLGKIIISSIKGSLYSLSENQNSDAAFEFNKLVDLPRGFNPKRIFISKSATFWISGDADQGLLMYRDEKFLSFNSTNGFKGQNTSCFMQDNARNLYIGTMGTGLYKTGPQLFIGYDNIDILNSVWIFSVLKDNVDLYIGVRKKGVYKFVENITDKKYVLEKSFKNDIGANVILKNNKNEILIGCQNGIAKITRSELKQLPVPYLKKGTSSNVVSLLQDKKSRYFIGTYGGGLCIADRDFTLITKFGKIKDYFADHISAIIQCDTNAWYIGTNNGLYILTETNKNKFQMSQRIIKDVISIATKDSHGNFWFAGGDCIYSCAKNGIKKYSKKNGLTSTLIYTLIADRNENIWIGSNKGVDKVEVNENADLVSIKNYNSKNGFRGLETNMRSQVMDADGDIYLGTSVGLVKGLVDFKLKNKVVPNVLITSLKINNQDRDWISTASTSNWVNVPDSGYQFESTQNQVTFRYNVSNTTYNDSYFYSYMLEGFDKGWCKPSQLNEANYVNLPSGQYTFKIKLVDGFGKSASKETRYAFSIKRAFYLSWWFIIGAALLFLLLFYLIFNRLSTYNKDFTYSNSSNAYNGQIQVTIFFLGIAAPLTEFFIELFKVRASSELIPHIIVGLFCLSIYYLSNKIKFIYKNLPAFIVVVVISFFIFSTYKIYFLPFELITFAEYCIVVFFAYSIFRKKWPYSIFMSVVVVFIIALFYNTRIPVATAIVFANISLFIFLINQARRISSLNSKQRLLFANNLVHNGSSLIIATNRFGEVSFASDNVYNILGYNSEEVMDMGFWNLTQDEDVTFMDYYQHGIQDKTYVRKLKCKNGEYKHFQWIDKKHAENLYVGIGQDISEQIKVQNQYFNLVQSATDIIYEADELGHFTFVNDVIKNSLGYTQDELLGQHFTTLVRPDYKLKVAKFYFKLHVTKNHFDILEFPVVGKQLKEYWVSQKVSVKRDGDKKIIGYSAIVRDITNLKNIEQQNAKRQEKINHYNAILNQLTTNPSASALSFNETLNHILTKAAEALQLDRISIWNTYKDKIESYKTFITNQNQFSKGQVLLEADFPEYFKALANGITVIANNVCENDYTKEFCLLKNNDIKSLLDVPVFNNGELAGLVCAETIYAYKTWDEEDINFTRSIADVISICIEAQRRKKAEKQLLFRSEVIAAVAKITEKLLISQSIQKTLSKSLSILGEATRVDKVYFYENNLQTNILTLKNEWLDKNKLPKVPDDKLITLSITELGVISKRLLENKHFFCITSKLNNSALKKRLEEQNVLSALILPIFVKDNFYGFIGFDDCKVERVWSDDQLNVVQSLATNIANAIERINNEHIIKEYSIELEFQNALKEKLINASSLEEITQQALGFVKGNTANCIHIALLVLEEKRQNLSGYFLFHNNEEISKVNYNVKDVKSIEIVKSGNTFIETDLMSSPAISNSDTDVIQRGVKSYVILPIMIDNTLIGTLNIGFDCVFNLLPVEVKRLEKITELLAAELEQLNLKNSLVEKDKDNISSLMYAKNIQNTILPDLKSMTRSLKKVCLLFKPRDIVSGDFYWAKETPEYTFVSLADCTGHGVPGAFLTLIGSRILEQIVVVEKITSPAEILTRLDSQLYTSLNLNTGALVRDGMEIAMCAIHKKTNKLFFAGAGMGLLYFSNEEEFHLKGQRKSIGDFRQDNFAFENHELDLIENQFFFMATDGYQDQLGGENYKRFSKKRTIDLLNSIKLLESHEQEKILKEEVEKHIGNYPQTDDITVLGFTIKIK